MTIVERGRAGGFTLPARVATSRGPLHLRCGQGGSLVNDVDWRVERVAATTRVVRPTLIRTVLAASGYPEEVALLREALVVARAMLELEPEAARSVLAVIDRALAGPEREEVGWSSP